METKIISYRGYVEEDSSFKQFIVSEIPEDKAFGDQIWFGEVDGEKVCEVNELIEDDAKEWLVKNIGYTEANKIIDRL